jgi:hypothetical protein
MQSFSENKQDIFVSSLLPINNGFYIDIGSYNPITNNNTYLLEQLGWNGICIEIDSSFNEEYKQRNCIFLNQDALNINYKNLFKEHNVPNIVDYLSLDIDEQSTKLLLNLPHQEFEFKIITLEHDFYLHKEKYQSVQRLFLQSKGYKLLFGNVYAEKGSDEWGKQRAYEDWWINPKYFNNNIFNLKKENIYPSEINYLNFDIAY